MVVIAYERLSFTRGLKLSNLPRKILMFWIVSGALIDGPRCGSIPISTILQKSVRFFIINVRKSVSIYPRSTLESHMKFNCSCTTCSSIEPASKFTQSLPKCIFGSFLSFCCKPAQAFSIRLFYLCPKK